MARKSDNDTGELIEVFFRTDLSEQLRVTTTPFQIPGKLARLGLSGLINQLLKLSPPRPFDFLIKNVFLRTPLIDHCKEHDISREEKVEIWYVEAIAPPELENSRQHDDWVSCLDSSFNDYVITGSYDGCVRLWHKTSTADKPAVNVKAHRKPIKAITVLGQAEEDYVVASGSQDQTIAVSSINPTNGAHVTTHIAHGHTGHVDSVCRAPENGGALRFASGSWDKSIKIWEVSAEASVAPSKSNKRAKVEVPEPKSLEAIRTLNGHTQCVSTVVWRSNTELFSGSWDHSIRCWDVETGACTNDVHRSKVVTCLSSGVSQLIAVASNDNLIRLFDNRSRDDLKGMSLLERSTSSHKTWVTGVAWHPTSEFVLASCSQDKTVKLWDIRSVAALHTSTKHTDKVFCVGWFGEDRVVSGGADGKLNTLKTSLKGFLV